MVAAGLKVIQAIRDESMDAIILVVKFSGPVPAESVVVLNAVIEAYSTFLRDSYDQQYETAQKYFLDAEKTLMGRIRDANKEYSEFMLEHPFPAMKASESPVDVIEKRRIEARLRQVELSTKIAGLEQASKGEPSPGAQLIAVQWAVQSGFDRLPEATRKGLTPLTALLATLRHELQEQARLEESFRELRMSERDKLVQAFRDEERLRALKETLEETKRGYNETRAAARKLELSKDTQGFVVRVLAPPHVNR